MRRVVDGDSVRVVLSDAFASTAAAAAPARQEWEEWEEQPMEMTIVLRDVSFHAAELLLLPFDHEDEEDDEHEADSRAFDRARDRLRDAYRDAAPFERRVINAIRLQLDLQDPPSLTNRPYMQALAALVTRFRQQDDSVFSIEAVACASFDGLVDANTSAQIASILQSGVRLRALRLHAFVVDGADSDADAEASTLLLLLRRIFPTCSSERRPSIESLSVNVDMPLEQLIAVCCVLTTDTSISALTLYRQDSGRHTTAVSLNNDNSHNNADDDGSIAVQARASAARWRWLARSLFSSEARHRIQRLTLDLGEALGDLAAALAPHAVSMDCRADLLLLGCDAAPCDASARDSGDRGDIGLSELTFRQLSAGGLDQVAPFLHQLQPRIKKVSVVRPLVTLHPPRLARLLEGCDGIQELTLDGARVPCLAPVINCAGRLRSLTLRDIKMRSARPLVAFLQAVADCSSPVGRSIKSLELEISESNTGGNIDYEAILDASLAALLANERLERCIVFVPLDPCLESKYRPVFDTLHGTPVVPRRRRSPLSIRRKAAFLSIVNNPSTTSVSGPIERLDSLVLARIFAFAAPCATRSCLLRVKS
ncbi:hypothetical protein PINS_up000865 [Pythium insidiosum]|nr:hypothetical protein PINS_up000865 [Pythium insidiosum]